jgi:hypothetical protein
MKPDRFKLAAKLLLLICALAGGPGESAVTLGHMDRMGGLHAPIAVGGFRLGNQVWHLHLFPRISYSANGPIGDFVVMAGDLMAFRRAGYVYVFDHLGLSRRISAADLSDAYLVIPKLAISVRLGSIGEVWIKDQKGYEYCYAAGHLLQIRSVDGATALVALDRHNRQLIMTQPGRTQPSLVCSFDEEWRFVSCVSDLMETKGAYEAARLQSIRFAGGTTTGRLDFGYAHSLLAKITFNGRTLLDCQWKNWRPAPSPALGLWIESATLRSDGLNYYAVNKNNGRLLLRRSDRYTSDVIRVE